MYSRFVAATPCCFFSCMPYLESEASSVAFRLVEKQVSMTFVRLFAASRIMIRRGGGEAPADRLAGGRGSAAAGRCVDARIREPRRATLGGGDATCRRRRGPRHRSGRLESACR